MQNTKITTRWRRVCRSELDRIQSDRIGDDSETSCRRRRRRRTGRRKGERGEQMAVSLCQTHRDKTSARSKQLYRISFSTFKEEEKSALYLSIVIVLLTRELSLVAPRVASVELASARPHRHRCDSRSCLRVRALFYGVRRIKNPLK